MTNAKILAQVVNEAIKATCQRAKCGSIIVADRQIIGRGFNSPPQNLESQRRCHRQSELQPGFKSDRTCCIHAEQRAILDAIPPKLPVPAYTLSASTTSTILKPPDSRTAPYAANWL